MGLFTGFLLVFHCRLIKRNETTNEYLKQRSKFRNFSFKEAAWCNRVARTMSCKRRQASLITNDLIRISLLLESMLDHESQPQSLGGTPKKSME